MKATELHQGFDHAGYYTEQFEAAAARFADFGFTVAPPSYFEDQSFATVAIMIGDVYISLSGVTDWSKAADWMRAGMGQGIQAFVLRGQNLEDVRSELEAHPSPVLQIDGSVYEVSRQLEFGGKAQRAAFNVVRLKRGSLPGLARCNYCEHLTRDVLWQPGLLDHPNTAITIETLTAVHRDPASAKDFYEQLFGVAMVSADGDLMVDCGPTNLRLVTPQRLEEIWPGLAWPFKPDEPLLAGLTIGVRDISATREALAKSGVASATPPGGSIAIAASDAYGGVLEFVTATSAKAAR